MDSAGGVDLREANNRFRNEFGVDGNSAVRRLASATVGSFVRFASSLVGDESSPRRFCTSVLNLPHLDFRLQAESERERERERERES